LISFVAVLVFLFWFNSSPFCFMLLITDSRCI